MSAAGSSTGRWARGTLASRSFVSREALAGARGSVADTLIRAFLIVVGSFVQISSLTINHGRELLRGSIGIHLALRSNNIGDTIKHAGRRIQVTLRSIDVGQSKLTHTFGTVIGHPISVTQTHIVCSAFAMAAARIGALRRGEAQNRR